MITAIVSVLAPLVILVATIFLTYRLGFFSEEHVAGRFAFLSGGLLLFAVAVWQSVRNLTDYSEWFIEAAYPVLDISQLALAITGALLTVTGLAFYADYWQTRREEMATRDQHLSILHNLQADSREPYQTMELLDISIREIVSHLSETSGAIFLLNRGQRQLVLTSSVGFTKPETAGLERYPYGQNTISQAIELTEPLLAGGFDFKDASGKTVVSRFNSCLVLPLISGSDKIGALVLVSPQTRHFGRAEIRYLSPVAQWLAEMIKSSRLTRELTAAKRELAGYTERYADLTNRIMTSTEAFTSSDTLTAFCRSLSGLADSRSVHLVGIRNGALNFFGGSEPMIDLSESYRTALIDALDKRKPLIINQEATGEEGRTFIAKSTLLYPVGGESERAAIMFLREGGPFRVGDAELKTMELYSRLARLALRQEDIHRLDITRRKGLDKILQLLRFDRKVGFQSSPGEFIKHLSGVFPTDSVALTFAREETGSYRAVDGLHLEASDYEDLTTLPGEGIVGIAATEYEPQFVFGKSRVTETIRSFDEVNRDKIFRLIGERGRPNYLAACPLFSQNEIVGVATLFMFDISESERTEWSRLLTLAAGLYSVRLTVNSIRESVAATSATDSDSEAIRGEAINKLNNHLSAIVGAAGLAEMRGDISGELKRYFRSIIDEAEKAAEFLRESAGPDSAVPAVAPAADRRVRLNDIVESVLISSRISDNLHMVGGRPRDIVRRLGEVEPLEFSGESVRNLFEEAINRFASLADEEDTITVATYRQDNYAYLDISRHHKNFPAVDSVAGFGNYERSSHVLGYRPSDTFLKHVESDDCYYSFDRVAPQPSYLSFKFPIKRGGNAPVSSERRPRILAIDDQPVILDLISAMCQTSGYDVKTAESGDEGLQMALEEKFDLILTDLAMPGMSGLEISHEVRKKRPNIPIVLVTGWEVNISREKMESAGISRVLYKPFRIEQLTELIETLIRPAVRS